MNLEVEVKSNSFENWCAYKNGGKVLFETHSNSNKDDSGKNLFTSNAKLWAHSFWNKTETKIIEALVYWVEDLKNYLSPKKHQYYRGKTPNVNSYGQWIYDTEWILVPAVEIRRFLFKHYITNDN